MLLQQEEGCSLAYRLSVSRVHRARTLLLLLFVAQSVKINAVVCNGTLLSDHQTVGQS